MLLKLSSLTGNDRHRRCYFNTGTITKVGPVAGHPDRTLILFIDRSKAIAEKPVEEVVETLRKYDSSLIL